LGKLQAILRVVISSSPLLPEYWKSLWAPWSGRILDFSSSSLRWKMRLISSNLLPEQPDSSIRVLRKLKDYLPNILWPFSQRGSLEHLPLEDVGC